METALRDGRDPGAVAAIPANVVAVSRTRRGTYHCHYWHPCQYCGFTVIQRRMCTCQQVWYCDDLCHRRDRKAHNCVCLWRRHRLVVLHWHPCHYCGFTVVLRRMCTCRQVWYCDELCQRRDWRLHKRLCLWHRHRSTEHILMAATLPEAIVADILWAADIQSRVPHIATWRSTD